jgi:hypothetical protein
MPQSPLAHPLPKKLPDLSSLALLKRIQFVSIEMWPLPYIIIGTLMVNS